MADQNKTNTIINDPDVKIEQPQFYIQLFSDWKNEEEDGPYERMMKEILLDHFLPDEID